MTHPLLNIIKWKKLLYIVATQFLFKKYFLTDQGFQTKLSYFQFLLLSLATISVLASGYLTNYSVRKRHRKHLKIPIKKATLGAIISGVFGVLSCGLVSYIVEEPSYILIGVVVIAIVTMYSLQVTKKSFFSNIINSFIKAFSVLIVWWYDTPVGLTDKQWDIFFKLQLIALLYIFLFFIGNIVRETIKDVINIDYDLSQNHKTIPILLGRNKAKYSALFISFMGSLIVFGAALLFIRSPFILITIFIFGIIPQSFFIFHLIKIKSYDEYKKILIMSDLVYISALISIPIMAYYYGNIIS